MTRARGREDGGPERASGREHQLPDGLRGEECLVHGGQHLRPFAQRSECVAVKPTLTVSFERLSGRPQEGLAVTVGAQRHPKWSLVSWCSFLNPCARRLT